MIESWTIKGKLLEYIDETNHIITDISQLEMTRKPVNYEIVYKRFNIDSKIF